MGYRSDVCIVCEPKAYEMLMDTIQEVGVEPDSIQATADKSLYKIQFESVKWYEDEPEISAIMKVLYKLDSEEFDFEDGFGYEYLRLGEESGDVDRRENIGCGGELYPTETFYFDSSFEDINESPKSEW